MCLLYQGTQVDSVMSCDGSIDFCPDCRFYILRDMRLYINNSQRLNMEESVRYLKIIRCAQKNGSARLITAKVHCLGK